MNDSEGAALLAAINENLNDLAPRLIYSDWLEENARHPEALAWRGVPVASLALFVFYEDGDGDGFAELSGYGSGFGSGSGSGYGNSDGIGYGTADGYGYGAGTHGDRLGSGDGYGYGAAEAGSGFGYGSGDRYGYGYGAGPGGYPNRYGEESPYPSMQKAQLWAIVHKKLTEGKPVIGKQMLIWCGRGFAWIGLVEEMYAPGCYKLSNAGMLCRTGPDSWMAVASGAARDNYVYRHAPDGIVYTGPELHGAVEWKGELPGRDMR